MPGANRTNTGILEEFLSLPTLHRPKGGVLTEICERDNVFLIRNIIEKKKSFCLTLLDEAKRVANVWLATNVSTTDKHR